MMKALALAGLVLATFCAGAAQPPQQSASCAACHGPEGISNNGEWPSLAGQKKTYLVRQLLAFREGRRKNSLMDSLTANLSDTDIQILAEYYAGQAPVAAKSGDKSLVDRGRNRAAYCVACHGMAGVTANEEWPNLAGQQAIYLEAQLHAFDTGERANVIMKSVLDDLSENDFAALAAYYSQLQP
jgi:cytochrome c553